MYDDLHHTMGIDFAYVKELYSRNAAWKLLRLDHAPLIISFLHKAFIEPNKRSLVISEFTQVLDDELYRLRQIEGEEAFVQDAGAYLTIWIDKDLLRKFWVKGVDEPYVDLKPSTEKAIHWVASLQERSFVGTESRLMTFVELLRKVAEESDPDRARRLEILHRQRAELDDKIAAVELGNFEVLSSTELRDRFQQIQQLATGLLADFREVEQNFRQLSRSARERIAMWDGSKGSLLSELWSSNDDIRNSDQGRSFEAFCDFLLSVSGREELSELLSKTLSLEGISEQVKGSRMERVHYDWIAAGEATQKTVASLSQQLRRFLDDQGSIENRQIQKIVQGIEAHSLALRDAPPEGCIAAVDAFECDFVLPMDRPLFRPPVPLKLTNVRPEAGQAQTEAEDLYSQIVVDRTALARHIRSTLEAHGAVTLRELTELQPLQHGLAELITYLDLGSTRFEVEILKFLEDEISWSRFEQGQEIDRKATLQRVLFKERVNA